MKPKTAAPANEDDAPPPKTSSTMTTTKTVPNQQKKRKLVGYSNFKRANPHSDLFPVTRFHSIEFFCQDAKTTANRFAIALGMNAIGLSDQTTTGNVIYNSYAMKSNELVFVFTKHWKQPKPCSTACFLMGNVMIYHRLAGLS